MLLFVVTGVEQNTVQEGLGHMQYADGSSYKGQFKKGKADGAPVTAAAPATIMMHKEFYLSIFTYIAVYIDLHIKICI